MFASDIRGYAFQAIADARLEENIVDSLHQLNIFDIPYFADWYFSIELHYPQIKRYVEKLNYLRLLVIEDLKNYKRSRSVNSRQAFVRSPANTSDLDKTRSRTSSIVRNRYFQKKTGFLADALDNFLSMVYIQYQKSKLGAVPMPSPFPGMNPYLENPRFWHQIHKWLTILIAEIMNPKISPKYWVSVEERVYQTTGNSDGTLLVGIPGNVVIGQSRVNIVLV